MRHFTLLKEVDAKIFAPEEDLGRLVDAALHAPPPISNYAPGRTSAPMSAQGSLNGSIVDGHNISALLAHADLNNPATSGYEVANLPRRQLFQHCAITMQNMLVSLDEKNHVISTAAEALNKQLARLDDCFPYIELEVSEEARYGSLTHWAYPENRAAKTAAGGGSRREVASVNHITAAAQHLVDEAAARSDARKQALLAKKGKNQPAESDFDEHHDIKNKPEPSKKAHGNSKVRKAADASLGVGLGITNGVGTNGNPPPKRRKVEKAPAGPAMERALNGVFGSNGTATKNKAASPRGTPAPTPAPEGPKKKPRGAAAANGHSRKRYDPLTRGDPFTDKRPNRNNTVTSIAMSPSLASSPIRSTFPEPKVTGRGSPAPTNGGGRPASSRARQNSTQSIVDAAKRPASSASNKPNGAAPSNAAPDVGAVVAVTGKIIPEVKAYMKESGTGSKGEHLQEDAEQQNPEVLGGIVVGSRKDSLKTEELESNGNSIQPVVAVQTIITTTKSGRASKPSTPAIPSFPDPPSRSRSSRAVETASNNKRSHKKGAGAAAQLIAQQNSEVEDAASSVQGDEEDADVDADEPTYCYCNGVSYGEMVACDGDGCEKEWFHLECAGLKVAPRGNGELFVVRYENETGLERLTLGNSKMVL